MEIENYIQEAIFAKNEKHSCFYRLMWDNFKESGFVITDEDNHEVDSILKATALQNILGEFVYRIYDEVNETGFEDVIRHIQTIGMSEDDIVQYCRLNGSVEIDEDDIEITVKNALDYTSKITADKMLEEFAYEDIFDYLFTVAYDFEQDFTFDFEDYEEMLAFIYTNQS